MNNLRATAKTRIVICGPRLAARVYTEIVVASGPCPAAYGTRAATTETAALPLRASAVVGGKVLEAHQARFGEEDVGHDWSVGGEAN